MIGAAISGALGSLAGGYLGYRGQKETNRLNIQLAREQMAFQERMSSTAHQRQVNDMRLAGLNPILSATGGGGASSPSGASATMGNAGQQLGEALSNSAKSFGDYQREKLALQQMRLTNANIAEQNKQIMSTTAKNIQDTKTAKETETLIKLQQSKTNAETKSAEAMAKINQNNVISSNNQADVHSSWLGKATPWIKEVSGALGDVTGVIGNVLTGQKIKRR